MSFGWSASDMLTALAVLNKIRVALKDSGGASLDYQEESGFLHSVSTVLETMNSLESLPLGADEFNRLQQICLQIQSPLCLFLDKVNRDFEKNLGPQPVSKNRFSKISRAPRMIQWALSTSKRVQRLKGRIVLPLMALQIGMSQQIMLVISYCLGYIISYYKVNSQLALQLAPETQARVGREINHAFDSRIRPWAEVVQSRLSAILARQSALSQFSNETLEKLREASLKLSNLAIDDENAFAGILRELSKYFIDVWLASKPKFVRLFTLTTWQLL